MPTRRRCAWTCGPTLLVAGAYRAASERPDEARRQGADRRLPADLRRRHRRSAARAATTATRRAATAATPTARPTACGDGIATAGEAVRRRQRRSTATAAAPTARSSACGDGIVDAAASSATTATCSTATAARPRARLRDGGPCSDRRLLHDERRLRRLDLRRRRRAAVDQRVRLRRHRDRRKRRSRRVRRDRRPCRHRPERLHRSSRSRAAAGCNFTVFPGVTNGGMPTSVATIPAGTMLADDTGTRRRLRRRLLQLHVRAPRHRGRLRPRAAGAEHGDESAEWRLPEPERPSAARTECCCWIADGELADAVSYEGVVQGVGNFGPFFHVTPYSAGVDRASRRASL